MADHSNGKNPAVLFFWETDRNCWGTDKFECQYIRSSIVDALDCKDFQAIERKIVIFLDKTSQINIFIIGHGN